MIPLPQLLADGLELPRDRTIVLVCRGGRRSTRAAFTLREQGHDNVVVLQGGMLSWESAGLLDAIGE
jgi:rhodanese-related sulfurtransferase